MAGSLDQVGEESIVNKVWQTLAAMYIPRHRQLRRMSPDPDRSARTQEGEVRLASCVQPMPD
jgi:hypothetical protein